MDPIGTFSGLASGVQWRDLVDQIIKVESAPITRLETRITLAQARADAWTAFKSRVQTFHDAASGLADGSALGALRTSITGAPTGSAAPLAASAGTGAAPGSWQVYVDQLATAQKLGGAVFASDTDALGVSGEFLVNGALVQIDAGDSLTAIASRINDAADAGVTASVAPAAGGYRLVLSSRTTGAAGIDLVDASGVLASLGLQDGSAATVKNVTSNGARGDAFADGTTAVGTLLGLAAAPAGDVVIGDPAYGGVQVTIDLATDSLDAIAARINAARPAGSNIAASVVAETVDGQSVQRLVVTGTTAFQQLDNHVLETLGVLRAGTADAAQQLTGGALTNQGTGAAAQGSDTLVALGANAGETLTLSGTRADGTAFTLDFAIGAGTTLDDLSAAISGASGLDGATVAVSGGRLVVTDAATGSSRTSLSIVAHNELGGTLDFGAFDVTRAGYRGEIVQGQDALIRLDGTTIQRSSNTITDAVPGLTLTLSAAASSTPLTVTVQSDVDASVSAIKGLVDAYNALTDWVAQQLTPPAEGKAAPPLYGDSLLRAARTNLAAALRQSLPLEVGGSISRLSDLGIEIDKTGRYTVDDAKLTDALTSNADGVTRLFGLYGTTTTGALAWADATDATRAGTYAVAVTTAAARAVTVGDAFTAVAGTDTVTVTQTVSGRTYVVNLAQADDIDAVVRAINAELATEPAADIVADVYTDPGDGSQHIRLTSTEYGAAGSFTIQGTNANVGFATLKTGTGVDVQGTIDGVAATGVGQRLIGADGTDAEGLAVTWSGAAPGAGDVTFSRGIASAAELAASPLLDVGDGSIDSIAQRLEDSITGYDERIDELQSRLDRRRDDLIRRFTAMEQAISRSQSQLQWLTGQLNTLPGYGGSKK